MIIIDKETLKKEIGKRVQKIREENMHMTKYQFAKLIGMKNQYLGTVESGKKGLTVEKVIKICNEADISTDYLLRGIDNYNKEKSEEILSKYDRKDICTAIEIIKDLVNTLRVIG